MSKQIITYDTLKKDDRILIKKAHPSWLRNVTEARFVRISPSGRYVELEYSSGNFVWESIREYIIVEVLK